VIRVVPADAVSAGPRGRTLRLGRTIAHRIRPIPLLLQFPFAPS